MKKTILLLSILIFITSCSRKEQPLKVLNLSKEKLVGSWILSEKYISPGGETNWRVVEDGKEYVFNSDGTFQASAGECSFGNFEVDMENDLLTFYCSDSSIESRSYRILNLTSSELQINYVGCIEACILKFRKQ